MTRPNLIITAAYLAVAGALVASAFFFFFFFFGITDTFIGLLLAGAAVAWSKSS
ncbi:MAG: hypothetical protein Devi2KO_36170 [Devosia indica]